ncbi:hypothetical protein C8A00DRAFT_39928 [Chaetomidium leptoderma]|uniref:Thymocyte nuclear protein 1 n=1 Tax=Chaetomidium leptoderma TaxID=669021 RepID=A0AAN6VU38_9PEZI|nr:hypothetical protein C8A00DRAFT_39928 [Chaetomidium leptoderma]
MPKRKSAPEGEPAAEPTRRRSVRLQNPANAAAAATETQTEAKLKPSTKKSATKTGTTEVSPPAKRGRSTKAPATAKESAPGGKTATSGIKTPQEDDDAASSAPNGTAGADGERNYWLLKAEPESRFENGVDVKFSIDDLAARAEPEPWDGIRAYAARNNLRAMKKGELAFFYHSNCKEPGIAGTMEIVQEHSPDLSAHDPKAPYYDPKSKPSDPRWSVVHVKFRSKFAVPIGLKELREMGGPGKPLENMQMLKQSRLSVSKVNATEWEYLVGVAEQKALQK